MLNQNKLIDKGNGFYYATSGGVSDSTLLSIATQFKTGVSRKYKMLPARLITQTFGKSSEVSTSIKYDGEGVYIFFEKEKNLCVAFNAPSGRTRVGLPCLKKAQELFEKSGIKTGLFVAELYLKNKEGKRTRVGDVSHISANGTQEEREALSLGFHDIIMLDKKDMRKNQKEYLKTWEKLGEIFGETTKETAHRVEGKLLPGDEIAPWFQTITEERGLEGIVTRFPNNETIYKIKPALSIDTVAIGYVEGEFEGKYGVLSILCALTDPSGKTLQTLCRVGSGLSDSQRENFLETFSTLKIESPIKMTDSDGRPITFIKPKIVVEVEGEAISEEKLNGEVVTSQTFQFDKGKLSFLGISPSAHLTHAVFAQLREDKSWDDGGTRMSQTLSEKTISDILNPEIQTIDEPKIFLREVYTKNTKEEVAVKKIVVIERSNKNYHKYTLHWTDFSASRKDALKTETQGVDTEERLQEILAPYKEETRKKGWTLTV